MFKIVLANDSKVQRMPKEYELKCTRDGMIGDLVQNLQLIGEGSESAVFRDGAYVLKVGEPYNDKSVDTFFERVRIAMLINSIAGDGSLSLFGFYRSLNGTPNPIFRQNYIFGRGASAIEIKTFFLKQGYQERDGFRFEKKINNKIYIVFDLDRDNVFVKENGEIIVIDAALEEVSR